VKYIYRVNGIKCSSCVTKIKNALKDFADSIEVSLNPPQIALERKDLADLEKLNAAVGKVGSYQLILLEEIPPAMTDSMIQHLSWLKTYYPLLMIIGMISLCSLAGVNTLHQWMIHFMAGFFLVFGAFKLIDLKGFRDAYATYDLLAKKWTLYGYIYPFLEIVLGLAFLFKFKLTLFLWLSLILMGFSSLGVAKALFEKKKIRCACLGTALKLPMTTVTLIEDLSMVVMAILMLM
jgi:copper chaperone CopZ